jgi:O-antigen/teichoic acid export membrane protein
MREYISRIKGIFSEKSKNSLTRQSVENSFFSLFVNLVSKAGGLIFTILLARALLPDLFGLYNLIFSIIATIATFTDLGINTALSRYLSDSLSKGKKYEAEARSRVRFLFNLKVLLSAVVSVLLFFLSTLVSTLIFHKPEMAMPLRIGSIYLFAMAIQGFLSTMFYPLKKLKYNFISEIIFQIAKIGLFLLLVTAYTSVTNVFLVFIIAYTLSIIFYAIVILWKQRKLFIGKLIPVERRRMVVFLGWAIILSSFSTVFISINTLMLGFFVQNNFLGYYATIWSIVMPIATLVNLGAIFIPIFTQIKSKRFDRGFKQVIKYSAMFAIPLSIGLSFVILRVIRVLYGPSYVPQEFYLPILISSILICLLIVEEIASTIYYSVLISKEKIKIATIIMVFATILNIILNYFLIKILLPYGQAWTIVGVSIATFITRYLVVFLYARKAKKDLGILPALRDILYPLFASIIMLGFMFLFSYLFNPKLWITVIMVLLAIIVYFVVLYFINKSFDRAKSPLTEAVSSSRDNKAIKSNKKARR